MITIKQHSASEPHNRPEETGLVYHTTQCLSAQEHEIDNGQVMIEVLEQYARLDTDLTQEQSKVDHNRERDQGRSYQRSRKDVSRARAPNLRATTGLAVKTF